MARFKPYRPDKEEVDYSLGAVVERLPGINILVWTVRFTGLVFLQYVCFWNRWRIVNPRDREVLYAGAAIWLLLAACVVLLVVFDA